jgi:hypothetical protein
VDELGVIGSAAAGPDGDLWVSFYPDGGGELAAMAHWTDGAWELQDASSELGDLVIGQFIVAPDGTLWVAAAPAAFFDVDPVDVGDPAQSLVLVSFDGTEFVSHVPEGTEEGITLNFPYSVITDGTSIWVGSMPGDGDFVRFTPE